MEDPLKYSKDFINNSHILNIQKQEVNTKFENIKNELKEFHNYVTDKYDYIQNNIKKLNSQDIELFNTQMKQYLIDNINYVYINKKKDQYTLILRERITHETEFKKCTIEELSHNVHIDLNTSDQYHVMIISNILKKLIDDNINKNFISSLSINGDNFKLNIYE